MPSIFVIAIVVALIAQRAPATVTSTPTDTPAPVDNSTVVVTGPASCETCNVFDGARWCRANLMCYIPDAGDNRTTTDAMRKRAEAECHKDCPDECDDISQCFATVNQSCGDCVFVGGWWSPQGKACFIGNDKTAAVRQNCILANNDNICITTDATCPACSRQNAPLYCSPQLAVAIVAGALGALFFLAIAITCFRVELGGCQRKNRGADTEDDAMEARRALLDESDEERTSHGRRSRPSLGSTLRNPSFAPSGEGARYAALGSESTDDAVAPDPLSLNNGSFERDREGGRVRRRHRSNSRHQSRHAAKAQGVALALPAARTEGALPTAATGSTVDERRSTSDAQLLGSSKRTSAAAASTPTTAEPAARRSPSRNAVALPPLPPRPKREPPTAANANYSSPVLPLQAPSPVPAAAQGAHTAAGANGTGDVQTSNGSDASGNTEAHPTVPVVVSEYPS
jgi:hypothetical protein